MQPCPEQRRSVNSSWYLEQGHFDIFSNETPLESDFETLHKDVADCVTFKLGYDTFRVSALKRGHLIVERTGPPGPPKVKKVKGKCKKQTIPTE